jgi:hypothetical protein
MQQLEASVICWKTFVEELKFLVMIGKKQSGYHCLLLTSESL